MNYFFISKADEKASTNPLLVMADEESGSRYASAVGQKRIRSWTGHELADRVEDMCTQLRAWGRTGGAGGELIVKSDGEPSLLAVNGAVMKHHGGKVVPEQPATGESRKRADRRGWENDEGVRLCIHIPNERRDKRRA